MASSPGLPPTLLPRQRRLKYKKPFTHARFVLQKSCYASFFLLLSIFIPVFLIFSIFGPVFFSSASLSTSDTAVRAGAYVDPCSTATPRQLLHFDPSTRVSKHYSNPVESDVDPPTLDRIFTTFAHKYLFQPNSDVVVNLNATSRGRPTDIRNGLANAETALRTFYNDDSLTVLNYSLGYEHLDRVRGSRYIFHLNVADARTADLHFAVALQRTFDNVCYVSVRQYDGPTFHQPVYIVLPYANRPKRLAWFLEQFEYLVSSNINTRLIISACRQNATDVAHVRRLATTSHMAHFITVIETSGDRTDFFSRAIAIREAAKHVPVDSVMFISDVDMYILPTLFDSCRYNVIQGSQVFFPVFYSLYARNDRISKSGGYWRESSVGMSCMYRSDFDAVGAYNKAESDFMGWGMEDKALSQAFKRDHRYEVFRAVEPALRHKWHLKHCEPLTPAYEDCLTVTFQQLGDMKSVGRFLLENHFDTQKVFAKFAVDDDEDRDASIVVKADGNGTGDAVEARRRAMRRAVLQKNHERARQRILEREKERELEWRKKTGITKEQDDEAFREKPPPGFKEDPNELAMEAKELAKDLEMMKKEAEEEAAAAMAAAAANASALRR